jgi:hypothetical protein
VAKSERENAWRKRAHEYDSGIDYWILAGVIMSLGHVSRHLGYLDRVTRIDTRGNNITTSYTRAARSLPNFNYK